MKPVESIHGLSCPNCSGMVPIPEGQVIVRCPYCDQRALVQGERGLQRFQVARRVERAQAETALTRFLSSSRAIAGEAARNARLEESFLVYLPFWFCRARVLGWAFGEEQVGSGDDKRFEPREVKFAEEMTWNGAACDVGEFGVDSLPLSDQPLVPFEAGSLHAAGMVFEPVGSLSEARAAGESSFDERVRNMVNLDRVAQVFVRFVRKRISLVYYPLWVLRYLYRGRSFQVMVDGYSGQVLYGKAPGNTLYRAAVLVGGMALGALVGVDGSALALYLLGRSNGDSPEGLLVGALAMVAAGFSLMAAAYRKFRYGEQYEFRGHRQLSRRFNTRKEDRVYRAREVQK